MSQRGHGQRGPRRVSSASATSLPRLATGQIPRQVDGSHGLPIVTSRSCGTLSVALSGGAAHSAALSTRSSSERIAVPTKLRSSEAVSLRLPPGDIAKGPRILGDNKADPLSSGYATLVHELIAQLLHAVVDEEVVAACRHQISNYNASYVMGGDGLSFIEHLWIDLATPIIREMLAEILHECFADMVEDHIELEWSEHILNHMVQRLVAELTHQVVGESLVEDRQEWLAEEYLEHAVKEHTVEVARECLSAAKQVDSEVLEDEDYALVNVEAADQIMNGVIFRHMLSILATKALQWDFEDFCSSAWLNQMLGALIMDHVELLQQNVIEFPFWDVWRGEVARELAKDHLLEGLRRLGAEAPATLSQHDTETEGSGQGGK